MTSLMTAPYGIALLGSRLCALHAKPSAHWHPAPQCGPSTPLTTKAALFKQDLKAAMRSRKEARMERDRRIIQMRSTEASYRTIADRFELSDAVVPHLCGR
jgi:hypothetical protein